MRFVCRGSCPERSRRVSRDNKGEKEQGPLGPEVPCRITTMLEARGSRAALVRAYDFFSHLYGRTAARMEREAVTRALARARVRPEERVLEVGVGTAAAFEIGRAHV